MPAPTPDESKRPPFVVDVARTVFRADITVHASNIAFKAAFSIGPLFALAIAILSGLRGGHFVHSLRGLVLPYAPPAARPLLDSQMTAVSNRSAPLFVLLSIVAVIWTISAWTFAISVGLEAIGWKVHAGAVRRRIRAAIVGAVMALALSLSAIAAAIGPTLLRFVSRATHVPFERLTSIAWLRWPVAAVVFGTACGAFVRLGTASKPGLRAMAWGGLTAGLVSWAASLLLRAYLSASHGLHAAYAAAGTVFALLLWLYVLAIGLLAGASVTLVIDRRMRA